MSKIYNLQPLYEKKHTLAPKPFQTIQFFIKTLKIKTGVSNECCMFDILKKKTCTLCHSRWSFCGVRSSYGCCTSPKL